MEVIGEALGGRIRLHVTEEAFQEVARTQDEKLRQNRLARLRAFGRLELQTMEALRDAAIEERLKVVGSPVYERARREAALEAGEKARLRRSSCRAIPLRVQKPAHQQVALIH